MISVKYNDWKYTDVYVPDSFENSLNSIDGVNKSEGTYFCAGGSVYAVAYLYVYDGATFSVKSELYGDYDGITGEGEHYTLTENGVTQEISADEFQAIYNDWESKNTEDISANTHLDIENIQNTFQVKIDIQNTGEWFVTNAE